MQKIFHNVSIHYTKIPSVAAGGQPNTDKHVDAPNKPWFQSVWEKKNKRK